LHHFPFFFPFSKKIFCDVLNPSNGLTRHL
jgi:hypothetical protein